MMTKLKTAWLAILMLFGSAVGIGVIGVGVRETRININASEIPTVVALVDLTPNGADGNVHVTLDSLVVRDQYVVVNRRGSWDTVYFVAVPSDPSKKLDRTVVVRSNRVRNNEDVAWFTSQSKITGVVTGEILEGSNLEDLERIDPELRRRGWIVVEEGRGVTTRNELFFLYGSGTLLVLVAVGQFVWYIRTKPSEIRSSDRPERITAP